MRGATQEAISFGGDRHKRRGARHLLGIETGVNGFGTGKVRPDRPEAEAIKTGR